MSWKVKKERAIYRPDYRRQEGAALLVSLVILAVITVLSLWSVDRAVLEERMSGNDRDRSIAFEAAEAALLVAEAAVTTAKPPEAAFASGSHGSGAGQLILVQNPDFSTFDWDTEPSSTATLANKDFGLSDTETDEIEDPLYVTEFLYSQGGGNVYRITVRAVGGSSRTVVMLQSTLGVP